MDDKINNFKNSLVYNDKIKSILKVRSKFHVERTIEQELKQRFFNEGWELIRDNSNTSRIRKEKPHNTLFEDKVWSIFAKMGFNILNADANLKLPYTKDEDIPGRQIDVFAADEETILIVECKSSIELRKKSMQQIINDFSTIQRGSQNFFRSFFGDKSKVKFILATNNIILNDNDKKRLDDLHILHFNQDDWNYYSQLTNYLGHAAKYQLLSRIFKNQEIPELKNKVPAIKGMMGSHRFFSFSIEPETLLKISYILHSTVTSEDTEGTYQRMVSKSRIKEIDKFLDAGGYFPNSIIININTHKEKPLNFDDVKGSHDSLTSDLCVLHLPKTYQSAFIIDGQHRLYGYANNKWKSKNSIPVVAFENLPVDEQVKMFVDINHKQKSVSKNLLTTIIGDLKWNSKIYNDAIFALQSKLLQKLGNSDSSSLYRRIIVGENKKSETTCITLDYIISYGFKKTNLFARIQKNKLISTGPLWVDGYDLMLDKSYAYFSSIFQFIKQECPDSWNRGNSEGGLISMNVGIMSIVRLCDSILKHLVENDSLEPNLIDGSELASNTIQYLNPITDYINKLSSEKNRDYRSAGTGGQGREKIIRELQKVINERMNRYNPEGLEEWTRDNSGKYNEESKLIVDKIQMSINTHVFATLREEFSDRWWIDGVHKEIQKKAANESIEKGRNEPDEHFVYLLDYLKIINNNWGIFKDIYSNPDKDILSDNKYGKSQKERALHWFSRLNEIRKKVSHPERAAVTEDEYKFLENLQNWLFNNIDVDDIQNEEEN